MSDEKPTGAWVITKVYARSGVPIDVKASGANGIAAVDDLYQTIAHGIEKYGWQTEQAGAPKPATTNIPASAPAQAVIGNMPANIDTSINSLEVVKVVVVPKPDNKVELQLFGQGHKFPDLYHNGAISQVMAALSGTGIEWKEEHLRVATEFDLSFFADWRNSDKLNKNGRPYKNIVGYRSSEATA